MIEEWCEIIGSDGKFKVSNMGNVWNTEKDCNVKIGIDKHGYTFASVKYLGESRSISVHRLVAIHFIPNPENKPTVNHINAIKTDNRLINLEWATKKEQSQHALELRLNKTTVYCCLVKDRKIVETYKSYSEARFKNNLWLGGTIASAKGLTNTTNGLAIKHYNIDDNTYELTKFDLGNATIKGSYRKWIYNEDTGKYDKRQMEASDDLDIKQIKISNHLTGKIDLGISFCNI